MTMAIDDAARVRYEKLFPDDETKARAFDRLAENYYFKNFATMQKAELDLLMFALYLDRSYALDETESDHSDYALSKVLGITQGRISSLKDKKELKYPSDFDWRAAFREVLTRAEYRDGRVRIYLRDNRLYTELENIVEELGSYSEKTLTKKLLAVSPPVFVDLMAKAGEGESSKESVRKELGGILRDNSVDDDGFMREEESFADALKGIGFDAAEAIAREALSIILAGNPLLRAAATSVFDSITKIVNSKLGQ